MKFIVPSSDPLLRKIAEPVPTELFDTSTLTQIIADMAEAVDAEPDGVAIAAPQIGESYRIFLVRKDRILPPPENPEIPRPAEVEVYVNPELIRHSRKKQESYEGCLSVRGVYGTTKRAERATVRARRADGTRFERGAGGVLAQIFQHEIDHLNGILFTDVALNLVEMKKSEPLSDD